MTTWGWIHLVLGVLVVVTGFALLAAATWARIVGLVLVILVAIANFLWLPYQPVWSIVIIVLSVATHLGADGRGERRRRLEVAPAADVRPVGDRRAHRALP